MVWAIFLDKFGGDIMAHPKLTHLLIDMIEVILLTRAFIDTEAFLLLLLELFK